MTIVDSEEGRQYTAGDVGRVTGLSYRQIGDWDARGALPSDPEREASWRRFTPKEIFVLLVCAELRKSFGVSLERLRFVREFMFQPDADHFAAAIRMISLLEVDVWLLTDFETVFVMDSELEFTDMWEHGFFNGSPDSYALLRISPLVNRMLAALKEPVHLPTDSRRGAKLVAEAQSRYGVRSQEEYEVLRLVRSGEYETVEIKLKDGTISRIHTTERPDPRSDLQSLLKDHDYQSVKFIQRGGRVVTIEREVFTKP